MSNDSEAADRTLREELKAISARLAHTRQVLQQGEAECLAEVGPRIEACARQIMDLPMTNRQLVQPLLLAVLDEVDRTIDIYQKELDRMRTDLTSAHQGRTAGAAYRQARKF